jgi:hypothetical protein
MGRAQSHRARDQLISPFGDSSSGSENLERVRLVEAVVQAHDDVLCGPEGEDLEQRHPSRPGRVRDAELDRDPVALLDHLAERERAPILSE